LDEGQQAAGGIARREIRINADGELVHGRLRAHAVERFAILRIGLPAHVVSNPGLGHEVAFVTGIDEDFAAKSPPLFRGELHEVRAVFLHALELFAEINRHPRVLEPLPVNLHRHVGLEGPFRRPSGFGGQRIGGLFVPEILRFRLLPGPGLGPGVVRGDLFVKLARQAADRPLVANIRRPQAAGRQPAEMLRPLDEDCALTHAMRLYRRRHPARGPAKDHDIGFDNLSARQEDGAEEDGDKAARGGEFHRETNLSRFCSDRNNVASVPKADHP